MPDLRGGFSHLIAALAAKGPSNVQGISLIDRGYADFRGKLEALGADFDWFVAWFIADIAWLAW